MGALDGYDRMSNSARRKIVEQHEEIGRLEAQRDALHAALTELVELKAMKDELSLMLPREEGGMGIDYGRRKPLAWQRARELVTPNAGVKRPVARPRQYYNARRISVGGPQVRLNDWLGRNSLCQAADHA